MGNSSESVVPTRDLAIISVDKDPDNNFNSMGCYDRLPTLKTKHLFVLAGNESWVVGCDKKGIFRFLHPLESFAAQGLGLDMAMHIHPNLHVKTTGNAYPPPVAAAMLAPLIDAVGQWDDMMSWPPDELMLTKAADEVRKAKVFKQICPKAKSKQKKVEMHENLKCA